MDSHTQHQQPFRFLDLPKELRLMVYERLVTRSSYQVSFSDYHQGQPTLHTVSLIIPDPVPAVHFICKAVFAEAAALLKKLERLNTTPRLSFRFGPTPDPHDVSARRFFSDLVTYLISDRLQRDMSQNPRKTIDRWFVSLNLNNRTRARLGAFFRNARHRTQGNTHAALEIALQGNALTRTGVDYIANEFATFLEDHKSVTVKIMSAPGTCTGTRAGLGATALYGGVIDEDTWDRLWT